MVTVANEMVVDGSKAAVQVPDRENNNPEISLLIEFPSIPCYIHPPCHGSDNLKAFASVG